MAWPAPSASINVNEVVDQDFLNALPPELRAEIQNDQRLLRWNLGEEVHPPQQPPGMLDNASFIATI